MSKAVGSSGGSFFSGQNGVTPIVGRQERSASPTVASYLRWLFLRCSVTGGHTIVNQNPRWTPKACIPRCLHAIFGSDYYVFPRIKPHRTFLETCTNENLKHTVEEPQPAAWVVRTPCQMLVIIPRRKETRL